MSAEIIPFPSKHHKKIDFKLDETENIQFPSDWPYRIAGTPVNPPTDAFDFLELCKRFLEPEDYTDLLVACMDRDAYDGMEPKMQKLVDNYMWFLRK